jgi:hypothetical protein
MSSAAGPGLSHTEQREEFGERTGSPDGRHRAGRVTALARRAGLVHAADPQVSETIKRTDRPYFVLDGNICALQAAKDHLNVFLYDGGIVPDPERIITGRYGNKTSRTVAIRQVETISGPALAAIFRQIIANNRAGGWRKLRQQADR